MSYINSTLLVSVLVVSTSALAVSTSALAVSQNLDVNEIVDKIDNRDLGDTSSMEMRMILEDKRGNQKVRHLQSLGKTYPDKAAMSIYFLSPADVKGSAFLSVDNDAPSAEDDTFLYLPALNKVRRVSQTNQSDSFMGSDFSFSDITGTDVNDWNYKILSDSESVKGRDAWLLESEPKPEFKAKLLDETGYTKRRIWVDKESFFVVRGQYFLKKANRVKLMQAEDIKQIDGIWTAARISMITTKNKKVLHRSTIEFNQVKYNGEISDATFTTSALITGPSL